MKTISVVTPCYNEEENIRDCYDTVRKIFEQELPSYKREHIFCDNASTDKSLAILREIAAADPCVKVIVNSRNFGPTPSTYNGVLAATGDAVLMFLPADMQDPPSLLPRFVKLWEAGNDIVYGIRAEREEGLVLRSVRRIYYWAVSKLSYIAVPPDVGDFQLVARPVIEAMRQIEDAFPYMRMMTFECGFTAVGVPYRWVARAKGISKNRLHHLVNEGMNGLITFSNAPMRMILFFGFCISFLSILYAIGSFVATLILGRIAPPGVPTLIVALFFFGGVQIFLIGVLGGLEKIMRIIALPIRGTTAYTGVLAGTLVIAGLLWSITLNRVTRHESVRTFLLSNNFAGTIQMVDVFPCSWDSLVGVRFYVLGNDTSHQGTACWDRSKHAWQVFDLKPF